MFYPLKKCELREAKILLRVMLSYDAKEPSFGMAPRFLPRTMHGWQPQGILCTEYLENSSSYSHVPVWHDLTREAIKMLLFGEESFLNLESGLELPGVQTP